jgi:hypothetical protein
MLRDVINGGDNVLAVGIEVIGQGGVVAGDLVAAVGIDHRGGHGLLLHVYAHGAFIIVENFL